jgi:hypothetical protein
MTREYEDEFNRRKLEEIGALESRIQGKRKDWLIILFVGVMVFSSCGFCATLTGHDISSLSNSLTSTPTATPTDGAISKAEESDQNLQGQLSYLEGLSDSGQQLGNDPSQWEQLLNSTRSQYENSSDMGNEAISDHNAALASYDPGSEEYVNITQILRGAYASNENESLYYDQMINEFNEEYGDEYGNLTGI